VLSVRFYSDKATLASCGAQICVALFFFVCCTKGKNALKKKKYNNHHDDNQSSVFKLGFLFFSLKLNRAKKQYNNISMLNIGILVNLCTLP